MRNITYLLIAFLITPLFVNAQQYGADTESNFSIISGVQSSLDDAIGYSIQDNGKWANARNRIPYSDFKTNRRPSETRKLGVENFRILELKKVLIDDIQYNVLLIKYNDGEYEFPILQEGWRSFESIEFYVFKAENLLKVLPQEIPFNQPYAVDMEVFRAGTVINYDPSLVDDKIVSKIQATQNQTHYNAANLVFAVLPVRENGTEAVRFKMIRSFSKETMTGWYLDPRNADELFSVSYYESKLYKFKRFIRDAEVHNLPTTGSPDDFQSFFNWGILKYQSGNLDDAISDFNQALLFKPDTAFSLIYSYRGIAKSKMGDHNGAIEDFDRAIDIQPQDVMQYSNWIKNYFNRGVSRFYTNDVEGACEDWKKSFEFGFGRALEYLDRFCK
ncbi:MAG: hypothetical protein CL663_07910 [Bacteroidetes bacterium]|nr:hypothetical protein [Bacteroidota bacterium]